MLNAIARRRRAPSPLRLAFVAALGAFAGSCAHRASFPPITPTPTGTQHLGMFVWHDLVTDNPEAAGRFYRELLGWRFEGVSGVKGYSIIMYNGRPIGGMIDVRETKQD